MQKLTELVQTKAASYPELAEICNLGEFAGHPEVPEVPEDSGLDAWSFGDPMLQAWKFRLASQLPKIAKQLGVATKNTPGACSSQSSELSQWELQSQERSWSGQLGRSSSQLG